MADELTLKWGTIKGYELESPAAMAALDKLRALGPRSMSAMTQHDTDEEKQAICDLIDALDAETVYLDWDGKDVTKEEAKRYVLDYGKKN